MIQKKANVTLILVMSLLLAVSSLQVTVVLDTYAGQSLQPPLTELLIPAVLDEAMGSAAINRQAKFKSWDGFCKDILIFSPPPAAVITHSFAALCKFNKRFAPSADQKILASRAPPTLGLRIKVIN